MPYEGTILLPTGDLTRYPDFWLSLFAMNRVGKVKLGHAKGMDVAHNLNRLVREMEGAWAFLVGDDHTFTPTVLERLLAHDVDIVVPLCLVKKPPFHPVVYEENEDGKFRAIPLHLIPSTGLMEVAGAGLAGAVIRRRVFEGMTDPWFEMGKTAADNPGEDLWFCHKAKQAGFKVYVDCGVRIGHIVPIEVWPCEHQGVELRLSRNSDHRVHLH